LNLLFEKVSSEFNIHQKNGGSMKNFLLILLTVILVSSLGMAEMKLKLRSDLMELQPQSIINKNLETNLKLDIPAEVVPPANMKDFVKGMFMLGILADVSIPFGDKDTGFKHIAGTGYSGHVMGSYVIAASWLLSIRAGYIAFGTQTTEGSDEFGSFKYEDTYTQIPILLAASYLFTTGSAFRPYLGLALGVFLQKYKFKWTESYEGFDNTSQEQYMLEGDASSTGFGIVPAVGAYYIAGGVMIHVAVEYTYLFSKLSDLADESSVELTKMNGFNSIAQEEEESSDETATYLSILLGVGIPLGGN
jgi:hypothetical protein